MTFGGDHVRMHVIQVCLDVFVFKRRVAQAMSFGPPTFRKMWTRETTSSFPTTLGTG